MGVSILSAKRDDRPYRNELMKDVNAGIPKGAIAALCRQEGAILAAYVFGSYGKGSPRPSSDLDVALLIQEQQADAFDVAGFVVELEKACATRVDAVVLNRAGEILKREVRRTGVLVFERDERARKHFEVMGRKTYEDFLHLHRRYVEATLYGK